MNLKAKRLKELMRLFLETARTEGIGSTLKRTRSFIQRRSGRKKGRFLPPADELAKQAGYVPENGRIISVVTALYNTDRKYLEEFIDSFTKQSCSYRQLILADASDTDHRYVGEFALEKSLDDSRIKYIKLSENLGISGNTNIAVSHADGEYIAFADHDDILSPDAIYQLHRAVDETGADIVYSDEALFDSDYTDPTVGHFKPDFSYYYLTNCNYICHLTCMRKELFEQLGGLDSARDGAQDHDLLLRATEIEGIRIHHIPRVLYYWRVHSRSTSRGVEAKPYVTKNAIDMLDRHLARIKVEGKAREGKFPSTYKIDYRVKDEPLVSIIIPNKDQAEMLTRCIDSIYSKTEYTNFEVLIVENNSTGREIFETYDRLEKEHDGLRVLRWEKPFNFSRINNFAAAQAKGDLFLLLNNDIEIINGQWLTEMVSLCLQKDVGIVGAMLYYPNDTIQHAGVITGLGGYAGHSHKYHPRGRSGYMFRLSCVQDLSCVTAACMLVRKDVYEKAHGLDEDFTVAFNDVDFCLRVRNMGYHILWTPYAECYHYESISRGSDTSGAKKERFEGERKRLKDRFGDSLTSDPFYNPNLTLDMEDFSESRVLPRYRS
ncbi:MAG: glycosyltransferase family 2 protein [Oscillospiraceae bacterium]|nr:glycosyltransferase family 2 protein [Oscillospiraceae bacterium]